MIEHPKAFGETQCSVVAAKGAVSDRVKRSAGDPATLVNSANGANSINDFSRRTTRKRQKQNALRSDALL
jgi:hypothetical protein